MANPFVKAWKYLMALFDNKIEALMQSVQAYLDKRLKPAENSAA